MAEKEKGYEFEYNGTKQVANPANMRRLLAELEDAQYRARVAVDGEPKGLFEKYSVQRKGQKGGFRVNKPFVLIPENRDGTGINDAAAIPALRVYADEVEKLGQTELATDIRAWMDRLTVDADRSD